MAKEINLMIRWQRYEYNILWTRKYYLQQKEYKIYTYSSVFYCCSLAANCNLFKTESFVHDRDTKLPIPWLLESGDNIISVQISI
jgi:hypothetical protein